MGLQDTVSFGQKQCSYNAETPLNVQKMHF